MGSSDWGTGILIVVIGIWALSSANNTSTDEKDHVYIESMIYGISSYSHPKKAHYHQFRVRDLKYKGKVFRTSILGDYMPRNRKMEDYIVKDAILGFHIEKSDLRDNPIEIYSMRWNGNEIVPLSKKGKFKRRIWIIGLLFLLVSILFFFKSS
jgi:hypothetical protein